MSFAGLEEILARVAAVVDAQQFAITFVGVRDDWASPGDYIVNIAVAREDLGLQHDFIIRSNGKWVSNQSPVSLRSKVRGKYRQLVNKMERRLNRTTPDAEGLYRRMTYND